MKSQKITFFLALFILYFMLLTFGRNSAWDSVIFMWSDVVSKSSNNSRAYDTLGFEYSRLGLLDKAFENYSIALKISPNHWRAHLNLGLLYFNRGQLELAEKEFLWSISYEPSYLARGLHAGIASAYYNLSLVYTKMYGRGDRSSIVSNKELLLKSLSLFKTNSKVYTNLAIIYMNEGHFELAKEAFEKAIYYNPYVASGYMNLGTLYASRGDSSIALEFYNKAIEVSGDTPQIRTNIANLYFVDKQYAQAEKNFKKAYGLDNSYLPAIDGLATIYSLQGKKTQSIEWFNLILKFKPDDAYALENIRELEK